MFTIGELSKITGVPIGTLNYWKSQGLLVPSYIDSNGWSYYSNEHVKKVHDIKRNRQVKRNLSANREVYLKDMSNNKILECLYEYIDGITIKYYNDFKDVIFLDLDDLRHDIYLLFLNIIEMNRHKYKTLFELKQAIRPHLDNSILEHISKKCMKLHNVTINELREIRKNKINNQNTEMLNGLASRDEYSKVDDRVYYDKLYEEVSKMKPRDRDIIVLYFGLFNTRPHTLVEIGKKYHLSGAMIKQIITRNVNRLKFNKQIRGYFDTL